jgi:hypothetical protein
MSGPYAPTGLISCAPVYGTAVLQIMAHVGTVLEEGQIPPAAAYMLRRMQEQGASNCYVQWWQRVQSALFDGLYSLLEKHAESAVEAMMGVGGSLRDQITLYGLTRSQTSVMRESVYQHLKAAWDSVAAVLRDGEKTTGAFDTIRRGVMAELGRPVANVFLGMLTTEPHLCADSAAAIVFLHLASACIRH